MFVTLLYGLLYSTQRRAGTVENFNDLCYIALAIPEKTCLRPVVRILLRDRWGLDKRGFIAHDVYCHQSLAERD